MPQLKAKKDQTTFNRGLNTEANELNFPDGFSTDERNYELLLDGSRRRRKGLAQESGGSVKAAGTISVTEVHQSYKWRGVAGNPTKHFIVHQVGSDLFFTDDAETISTSYHTDTINLDAYAADATVTAANIADTPLQFSQGNGHLLVSSKYIEPIYIVYDPVADDFTSNVIQVMYRDFDGIDDGIGIDAEPTDVVLPADHNYNIRNRGWKQEDIEQYESDVSKWPAKNSLWYRGYIRALTASTAYDQDGIQSWSSTKLDAEAFGNASAPQGSLFLDPRDTTAPVFLTGGGEAKAIETWSFTSGNPQAGGTITVTTVENHGYTSGADINISGAVSWFNRSDGEDQKYFKFNGSHNVVSAPTLDTLTFVVGATSNFSSWAAQYAQLGQIDGGLALTNSDGVDQVVGWNAIEFHAGRVFIAGMPAAEHSDTIFFSKVALKANAYGKCHQEADPTSPDFNALTPADGGTIIIPGMGQVFRMRSLRNLLIVYTDQGVWEIGGGQRGFFTADGYSVRKITEAECSSPMSPIHFDSGGIYTGPKGIFQIAPNEFTSKLEATNISEKLIQTKWNAIPVANQKTVQTVYDDARKRILLLYGATGVNINQYSTALVLDLKVGAFYPFTFNADATEGILTAYAITDSDASDSANKVKWTVQSTNNMKTCDLNQTDYLDYDGAESPLPYVVTGHDNIGDFQRRRQAPVITVYAKRTETGYTETGDGWDGDNESSTLLQAFWDWSDDAISGKIGSQNETYRHVRGFVPSGAGDVDGYPVVVTRNKIRGRGRALQLRFEGAATKDSHILGYTTNYKIQRAE